jgi:hypothetical protein
VDARKDTERIDRWMPIEERIDRWVQIEERERNRQ